MLKSWEIFVLLIGVILFLLYFLYPPKLEFVPEMIQEESEGGQQKRRWLGRVINSRTRPSELTPHMKLVGQGSLSSSDSPFTGQITAECDASITENETSVTRDRDRFVGLLEVTNDGDGSRVSIPTSNSSEFQKPAFKLTPEGDDGSAPTLVYESNYLDCSQFCDIDWESSEIDLAARPMPIKGSKWALNLKTDSDQDPTICAERIEIIPDYQEGTIKNYIQIMLTERGIPSPL